MATTDSRKPCFPSVQKWPLLSLAGCRWLQFPHGGGGTVAVVVAVVVVLVVLLSSACTNVLPLLLLMLPGDADRNNWLASSSVLAQQVGAGMPLW